MDTLPPPIVNAVNKGGPWVDLTAEIGGAFFKRVALVKQLQEAAAIARRRNEGVVAAPQPRDPIAADPSRNGAHGGGGIGEVIAPEPRSYA